MNQDSNLSYENAPKQLAAIIIGRRTPATRKELEILFQRHCIGHKMSDHILSLFKDNELARLVVLSLYRSNVIVQGKEPFYIIQQLTDLSGCHKKTIFGWVKTEFNGLNEQG